ncbi:helix-turn-helix domain-containing protein [Traorella massiliensis]|uniref:helix-turn-helix domain-containing protein n=1 Tax=Traorella massiliensis TaxID=1903263 RepID=UPI0008F84EAC|nr:helix-turn-helix transcriptional regulator [Traorella massiliensis]
MNIKRNLKLLRNRANLSQREIEKYTGISYLTIFRIETGKTSEQKITIDTISKLASFFQVTIDDFIYKDLSQFENVSPGDTERNHL